MGNTVKISFSAVTHIGSSCTVNNDRIFANGRFIHPSMADYAQISLEAVDTNGFFALSGNMEDDDSGISLTSDLQKFHQKAMSSSKDIHVKLDDLVQCIEQSSNLIHSLSLGEDDFSDKRPSFAGILIDDGNIAAANLGSYRIYKLEGDTFKLLVNDHKRAERLLKMGIISDEQAELLSAKQMASIEEGRMTVKKSDINPARPGITYLICSDGLADTVDEDTIYDIIASGKDADEAAGELVSEAANKEPENDVTALVIKIMEAEEHQLQIPSGRPVQYRKSARTHTKASSHSAARRQKSVDVGKIVSVVVLVFLSTAVLFGVYKLWTIISPTSQESSTDQGDLPPDNGGLDQTENQPPISDGTDDGLDQSGDDDITGTDPNDDGTGEDIQDPDDETLGPDGTTYTVKQGDMLVLIAEKYYGDQSKYTLIMKANDIKDPGKIFPGQVLEIPPDTE